MHLHIKNYAYTDARTHHLFSRGSLSCIFRIHESVKVKLGQGFPEILKGTSLNHYISRYTPPFDEFEVDRCLLRPQESVVFPAIPGPSIFVVLDGEGRIGMGSAIDEEVVTEGHVYFVPAYSEIALTAAPAGPLQLYRSGVNSRVL